MAVRPNIQSPLTIDGEHLVVEGESDNQPLPVVVQVVVVQKDKVAGGPGKITEGEPERASANWRAKLSSEGFAAGPAETVGVEIRVTPFQVTSWTQSVTIE